MSPAVYAPNGNWARTDLGSRRTNLLQILAIGSSSTEGVGASQPAHCYPAVLEALLDARFPERSIRVVNAGIGGETAAQTVARLEAALAKGGYDLVIWQVGTNDAVQDIDQDLFRATLERGIDAARQAATPLILVDPQYYPDSSHQENYEDFVTIIDDVGRERSVPVFSRYALMKAWAGQSAGLLKTMLSSDGFHMSDRGYACWASLLADDIAGRIPTLIATGKGQKATGLTSVAAKSTKRMPPPTP